MIRSDSLFFEVMQVNRNMELFTNYENIQIDEVCRICLTKKDEMNLIFETSLTQMLMECCGIQFISDNEFLSYVCTECQNEVSKWYVFKQQIIKSFQISNLLLNRKVAHNSTTDKELTSNNVANESSDKNFTTNAENIILNDLICTTCNKKCSTTSSYHRHIKTHDEIRSYACCKCDKSFKTSQVLSDHMRRHYNDRRYPCEFCNNKFYSKSSLTHHMRSHTGEKPFKCEVCFRCFSTKPTLKQHMTIHTLRERTFQCHICNKFLLTAGSLGIHIKKHSGIKPFPCSGCGKSFFTKEAMQRHFGAIHDLDNNFLCNICSKVCSTKVCLTNHMKKKHLGIPQASNALCSECGKQCGSAAELIVHMRIHTGEKPYICDICNKGFTARGNLNSHKLRHSGKKPFLCKQCGKNFVDKSTLKVHERIHTGEHPYKCEICDKTYVQSSALRTHLKSHCKQ